MEKKPVPILECQEHARTKSDKEKVKDVTVQNLFAKIQCALFKGTERVVFIDKRDFEGPLYEQIEEAYEFVLKHINLGAEISDSGNVVWITKRFGGFLLPILEENNFQNK